jgi:hypothetical protein
MSSFKSLIMSVAGTFALAIAAGATASNYNPDNLQQTQIEYIAQICQATMGLKPSEPPVSGVHPGMPHLDTYVSHYQGCIASLSDSIQQASDAQIARQADSDCRAKGLQSDSPELAMCVLTTANGNAGSGLAHVSGPLPSSQTSSMTASHVGSFFYASPHETRLREQNACAQLGLEPYRDDFSHCVKSLETTFFVIDNPLD